METGVPIFKKLRLVCLAPLIALVIPSTLLAQTTADSDHNLLDQVALLQNAIEKYEQIDQAGGWEVIPDGPLIEPGDRSDRVEAVTQRLIKTGDFKGSFFRSSLYVGSLVRGVKHFQTRNGLDPDGLIGPATLKELNKPVAQKISILKSNLARAKTLRTRLPENYVLVNVAGYELVAVKDNKVQIHSRVVVGTTENQTPIFNDKIRLIELNPYWNVPTSISAKELIPLMAQYPDYLDYNHMQLSKVQDNGLYQKVSYQDYNWSKLAPGEAYKFRMRQEPGPWNALGEVKIIFPNQYDVYLHDTPQKDFFKAARRSFSHGCIRVQKALDLALYLVSNDSGNWTKREFKAALKSEENQTVNLKTPIPIFLIYNTAWVDAKGLTQFRPDIYKRD
ncbi:MAG: L,D-transpeptidase family protein [Deltaproteobacteria bacterium]|nr:L,D-transpeptidase family protein [Deltaproteobacteria bacterium]